MIILIIKFIIPSPYVSNSTKVHYLLTRTLLIGFTPSLNIIPIYQYFLIIVEWDIIFMWLLFDNHLLDFDNLIFIIYEYQIINEIELNLFPIIIFYFLINLIQSQDQ